MAGRLGMNDADSIIDLLEEYVSIHDREGRLLFMNAASRRRFDRPVEELLGRHLWDLVPPGPRTPFREALEAVLAGAPRTRVESRVAAFDCWYEIDVSPHPRGALVVARDITDQRRREAQLRASEARFREMVEQAPEAILILNLDERRIEAANGAAERLFGRPRAELVTLRPEDLSPPLQPDGSPSSDGARRYADAIARDGSAELEWTLLGAGGKPVLVEMRARVLGSRAPVLVRVSLFDITERSRERERREAACRLEAVGRLAAGVAHDFNNLLTIITGATQLALARAPSSPVHRDLVDVLGAAERAALITRQLLTLARKREPSPGILDLGAQLRHMKPLLQRMVGEDVEVDLDLGDSIASVRIAAAHVEQIVLNLAANARDAMPKGGRLTFRASNVTILSSQTSGSEGVRPGDYVRVSVSDTGTGISAHVKPHIFEPFFTTKELCHGTGLGLATVHGIVQQNEGHIRVASEPGMGTTFEIYLPRVDGPIAPTERPAADDGPDVGGTETILLVDDDDDVRRVVRRALEHGGYTVVDATNAGEALLLFETSDPPIDLLVTDMVMPRITGAQLAKRLRASRPDLRVLYLSGYAGEHPSPSADGERFVSKPVTVHALLKGVREALTQGCVAEGRGST